MHSTIIATQDETLRVELFRLITDRGFGVSTCATWRELIVQIVQPTTRYVIVDAQLKGLDGELLTTLNASLKRPPSIYCVNGHCPPLTSVSNATLISRLRGSPSTIPVNQDQRDLIPLLGWGEHGLDLLNRMSQHAHPIRIVGERGTGKEHVARLIHALGQQPGPFRIQPPSPTATFEPTQPGTLYLENLNHHSAQVIQALRDDASRHTWRVIAGSRQPHNAEREGENWVHLNLAPLRDRPKDIRPLTRYYLKLYEKRLGLPRRRIHGKLWALIERYPWPGNRRELEAFVVQAATSARGASLTPNTLPPSVLDLLRVGFRTAATTEAYERMVENRLRPVVQHFEHSDESPTLYRLVLDATERALIRITLNQTGGNQKAAAHQLGIARNTLRERLSRLDPFGESQ